jgi:Ca2+/Na+ antiporter
MTQWVSPALVVLAVVLTFWVHILRRNQSEREERSRAHLSYRQLAFLAVFLPLVGLMALLQLFVEHHDRLYLVLAVSAALAVAVGIASFAGEASAGKNRPRRR